MSNKFLLAAGIVSGWVFAILLFVYRDHYTMGLQMAPQQRIFDERSLKVSRDFMIDGNLSPERNPIPPDVVLSHMSEEALELLFHRYISSTQATCSMVERMGKITDGGWEVCLDPRYAPDPKNCLVYSFGINYQFSFDDAIAKYGCEVHSFDPSMTKTKDHLRGKRVHFHLEGVSDVDLSDPPKGEWKLYTIGTIRKRLGHNIGQRRIDVLKMDVEGFERKTLPQVLKAGTLADIPQISFEMHHQRNTHFYLINLPILRDLYAGGFRIFHTNRNTHCQFTSPHTGMVRTQCHEVYMVNVTLAKQTD